MTDAPAGTAMTEPIESDHELGRVVADVVGVAIVDRVWVMFLDGRRRVLPTLLPVDGFRLGDPLTNGEVRALIRLAEGVAATIDAVEAVVVWERVGGRRLLAGERILVERLAALFPLEGLALRAQFLSHSMGVLKL